jgi:hypothetical protein
MAAEQGAAGVHTWRSTRETSRLSSELKPTMDESTASLSKRIRTVLRRMVAARDDV